MKNIELVIPDAADSITQTTQANKNHEQQLTVGDFVRVRVTDYAPLKLYGELIA